MNLPCLLGKGNNYYTIRTIFSEKYRISSFFTFAYIRNIFLFCISITTVEYDCYSVRPVLNFGFRAAV